MGIEWHPIAGAGRNQHHRAGRPRARPVAERVRPVLLLFAVDGRIAAKAAVMVLVVAVHHRLVHHVLERGVDLQRVDVVLDLLLGGHKGRRAGPGRRAAAVDDVLHQLGLVGRPGAQLQRRVVNGEDADEEVKRQRDQQPGTGCHCVPKRLILLSQVGVPHGADPGEGEPERAGRDADQVHGQEARLGHLDVH
uniref:(northern house mosquito) hypothetical protein n=2 Tax=Culex pipiens TaxID=7175 RepID=A0A8D8CCJ8_CULPI